FSALRKAAISVLVRLIRTVSIASRVRSAPVLDAISTPSFGRATVPPSMSTVQCTASSRPLTRRTTVPPPADVSVTWAEPAIWSGWTVAEKVCSVLELGVGVADARAGTLQVRHAVLDRDRRDPPAVIHRDIDAAPEQEIAVGIGRRFQQATGTRGLRDLDHRLEHRVVPVTRALFQRQEPPF